MGQTQGNTPAPKKKTEEQIKEDMKRKWDNFGTTQASNKINDVQNNNNNDNIIQENIKKEESAPYLNKNEEIPVPIEEKKEEEEKEDKKFTFLALKLNTNEITYFIVLNNSRIIY